MKSRWVPYASTPGRLLSQLFIDLVVIGWTAVWVFIGMAVHSAVATIAEFGYRVESGANGVAGNLDSAAGANVLSILERENRAGTTLVLITHDPGVAGRARRRLWIRDGVVSEGSPPA